MTVIKFCFIVPFLFLLSTESLPVHQPPITPSHVLHIRKDFPGIISFGPIFISSVKRGLFTDHVSVNAWNGCANGNGGYAVQSPCREKLNAPEIFELEEPSEVIPVQEDKPDGDGEIGDLISDYNDFVNRSTLTSEEIYLNQAVELGRIRERELHREFEILNQVKEVPDKWEPEDETETPFVKPSYVHSYGYEHFEHSYSEPNHSQQPEFEPKHQSYTYETHEYKPYLPESGFEAGLQKHPYETEELSSVPNEPFEPDYETTKPLKPISEPLEYIPEQVRESERVNEYLTDGNIWGSPTSPEVAQSIREYIENRKPGRTYPCPPRDSTQISERHENFIKSSLTGVNKRIKNYYDGIRAFAARHYDNTHL